MVAGNKVVIDRLSTLKTDVCTFESGSTKPKTKTWVLSAIQMCPLYNNFKMAHVGPSLQYFSQERRKGFPFREPFFIVHGTPPACLPLSHSHTCRCTLL